VTSVEGKSVIHMSCVSCRSGEADEEDSVILVFDGWKWKLTKMRRRCV